MLPEGQTSFTEALIHPGGALPEGIVDPKGRPAPKRFAVYQNNVIVSLTEALTASFPAVHALVGEDFFKGMAQLFIRRTPPVSPLLNEYGRDFPDFIAGFEPAAGLPFLPDVARIDRAWLDAYHAADTAPLDPALLAGLNEDALMQVRFVPLPATRLVSSEFAATDIWLAAKSGNAAAGIDPDQGQGALIVRPDVEVGVHALTPAEAEFFQMLIAGERLGDAAEKAAADTNFDLSRALGLAIGGGAFGTFKTEE